jgi:hypothetical protein
LIDARLLGRLSWLLNYRTPERKRAKKRKKERPEKVATEARDPWEVPDDVAAAMDAETNDKLPVEGYGLMKGEPPPLEPPRQVTYQYDDEDDGRPIGVEPVSAESEEARKELLKPLAEVSAFEAKIGTREKEPDPPKLPLWSGIYQFPWYAACILPWLRLSFGSLVMGGLLKIQMLCWWL